MTITVVIASYKYGHLAAHAIESVLAQTVAPDRIMFVDDGVGDCKHLPQLYPSVEYILREENLGTVANFQDMLNRVETTHCMFLGADNWLRADALEILSKRNGDIITYDIVVTGDLRDEILEHHKKEVRRYYGDYYWTRRNKHHGSMLYNTQMAKSLGYAAAEGRPRTEEDAVLWKRMVDAGATVAHVAAGLLYYRRHRENFNK